MPRLVDIKEACLEVIYTELIETSEACRLYDKLTTDANEHNCLGCQFMDLHRLIYDNFKRLPAGELDREFFCKTYIFWLYFSVERVYEIFDMINHGGRNKLFKTFFEKHFTTTKRVKRWANFLKHPKAFQFTHHPSYRLSSSRLPKDSEMTVIDSVFVEKYYQGNNLNRELTQKLVGKENVCVVFPDLLELTRGFCSEFKIFVDFICSNDMVADYLRSESTITSYYTGLDEDSATPSVPVPPEAQLISE